MKGQFPNHFDLSVGFVIGKSDAPGVELLYHAQGVTSVESKFQRTYDLGSCSITNVSSDATDTYNSIFESSCQRKWKPDSDNVTLIGN